MNPQDLEFLISQYADGSLSEPQRAEVERRLAEDAQARALWEQFQHLDLALKAMPLPAIRWEALAAHLSQAVAAQAETGVAAEALSGGYRMPWVRHVTRWAIAAAIVLATGVGILATRGHWGRPQVAVKAPEGSPVPSKSQGFAMIEGPQAEPAAGKVVDEVQIGEPSGLAEGHTPWQEWRSSQAIVTGAPRVVIAGGPGTAQDTLQLPY